VHRDLGENDVCYADRERARQVAADYAAYVGGGTHADIGTAVGQLFPVFGPTAREMHPDHLDFARACRDETARLFPELVEEIDAQAKAAGRSADDTLWHYCLNVGAPPARAAGTGSANCSSVGVMTAAGPVIARNYDFFYFETWRHLVTVQPRRGLAHTGMWPGLLGGRYDGVNAAGVWVSIHGGGPSA